METGVSGRASNGFHAPSAPRCAAPRFTRSADQHGRAVFRAPAARSRTSALRAEFGGVIHANRRPRACAEMVDAVGAQCGFAANNTRADDENAIVRPTVAVLQHLPGGDAARLSGWRNPHLNLAVLIRQELV